MREELTGHIALHCRLARMDGYKMDKKAMRFNAMAEYCMLMPNPISCVDEAICSAFIGDAMNVKNTPIDVSVYDWMELGGDT